MKPSELSEEALRRRVKECFSKLLILLQLLSAEEKLLEKVFDEVLLPESEKQSGEEVIELESAAAKDPSRCQLHVAIIVMIL